MLLVGDYYILPFESDWKYFPYGPACNSRFHTVQFRVKSIQSGPETPTVILFGLYRMKKSKIYYFRPQSWWRSTTNAGNRFQLKRFTISLFPLIQESAQNIVRRLSSGDKRDGPEMNGSWNNGFFINNSPKTQPQDQMSTEVVYVSSPNSNSGERYHNVITRFVYGRLSFGSNNLARPKSASLISPFR